MKKTNAMRILDQSGVAYQIHEFQTDCALSGVEVARLLGEEEASVFKTLVTVGKSKAHYVFMIPVAEELDLKKAAACVKEKNIEMVKSKELLGLTGYIHGGCSPVGMKKTFPITIDSSADKLEHIFFSGGKIGMQVELDWKEVEKVFSYQLAEICVK